MTADPIAVLKVENQGLYVNLLLHRDVADAATARANLSDAKLTAILEACDAADGTAEGLNVHKIREILKGDK